MPVPGVYATVSNDETQRDPWHMGLINWGQFLLAIGIAMATILGTMWVDRLAVDRRLTILEERQTFVIRELQQNDAELAAIRADIARRLDAIQAQLVQISIDLARHQSRVNGEAQGNGRMP